MKKNILFLVTLLVMLCPLTVFAADGIIIDSSTYVPLRGVFEQLGFTVNWNSYSYKATLDDGTYNIICQHNGYRVNDEWKANSIATGVEGLKYCLSINGTTYIPLRTVSELIDADVSWNSETKVAHISYNGKDSYINVNTDKRLVEYSTEFAILRDKYTNNVGIGWAAKNNTTKTVKRYTLNCTFFDGVGDICNDLISGYSFFPITVLGPVEPGKEFLLYYDDIIYSNIVARARINSINIEYIDGSEETILYKQETTLSK